MLHASGPGELLCARGEGVVLRAGGRRRLVWLRRRPGRRAAGRRPRRVGDRPGTQAGSAMTTTAPTVVRQELHARVLAFIRRRVPSVEDAEDIAQEVMLRVHRHSAELEDAERMTAWVYRIATNAIADHYRRPARRELAAGQATDLPLGEDLEAWSEPPPDALRTELAACLTPLIERLPALHREALELTEFHGLSQVEAAERLGISVSGMKSRVQRARGQLLDLLLACCHVDLDRRRSVTAIEHRGEPCGTCGRERAQPTPR
jgi:RNA polymerase sigma-70 factor (ECF subfamily)